MSNLEMCCHCNTPTGRAGIGGDSLYADDYGPYCEECWSELPDELVARIRKLEAALREIASGRYSGLATASLPPQDPAVNLARTALGDDT